MKTKKTLILGAMVALVFLILAPCWGGKAYKMAQTQQAMSACFELLADNTKGLISERDLRDCIESTRLGYASMSLNSAATTNFLEVGVFTKLQGATTLGPVYRFESLNHCDAIYTGDAPALVDASASLTLRGTELGHTYLVGFALDGVPIPASMQRVSAGAQGGELQTVNTTILWQLEMIENGQLDLWCCCESGTAGLICEKAVITIRAMTE